MSASSKTTNGLLPPSSMLNFFSPAAWTMRLPVTVEPVNEIAATSGWRQSGSPASLPKPWTTLRTPAGIPASSASSPRRAAVNGDSSLIFRTAVLPNASAGATFQVAVMNGTFQGLIEGAHADRVVERVVQVRRRRIGVAVDARAHLGEVVEVVGRARHQLLAGLGDGLAGVQGLGARDLRNVRGDQVAELAHEPGALGRRAGRPISETPPSPPPPPRRPRPGRRRRLRPALPASPGRRSRSSSCLRPALPSIKC